jgi:hypothetical protein
MSGGRFDPHETRRMEELAGAALASFGARAAAFAIDFVLATGTPSSAPRLLRLGAGARLRLRPVLHPSQPADGARPHRRDHRGAQMKRLLSLLLLTLLTTAALAEEPKAFVLNGRAGRDRMRTQVRIIDDTLKAIRVYAEPSGTLLAVVVNDAGKEPMSKSKWFERTFPADARPDPFPYAAFEFKPDRAVIVRSSRPKPGDDSVSIYVHRGKKEEKFVVRTNPTEFELGK